MTATRIRSIIVPKEPRARNSNRSAGSAQANGVVKSSWSQRNAWATPAEVQTNSGDNAECAAEPEIAHDRTTKERAKSHSYGRSALEVAASKKPNTTSARRQRIGTDEPRVSDRSGTVFALNRFQDLGLKPPAPFRNISIALQGDTFGPRTRGPKLQSFRRSSSGSLAKFAAMRRASSRVSSLLTASSPQKNPKQACLLGVLACCGHQLRLMGRVAGLSGGYRPVGLINGNLTARPSDATRHRALMLPCGRPFRRTKRSSPRAPRSSKAHG